MEMEVTVTPVKQISNSDKFTIPPSPFLTRLGYGSGVSVLQMTRSPKGGCMQSPWALKMLIKKRKIPKLYEERIQQEADILKKLSHPNVVGFRMYDKDNKCLGMEKCDKSLRDIIEDLVEEGGEPFQSCKILKVAHDIGNALDYIHTKVMLLHGDMKSSNILINKDFDICKLCDFGVSLYLDENGVVDKSKNKNATYLGTESWSPPEIIAGNQAITSKADIFPLGLVLWEMMSLNIPNSPQDETLDESVVCLDDDSYTMPDTIGTRPPIPYNINVNWYKDPIALFYCLTEEIPAKRPTAQHVAICAQYMLDQENQV